MSAHVLADVGFAASAVLFAGGLWQAYRQLPRTPAAVPAAGLGVYFSLVAGVDALAGVLVGASLGVCLCAFFAAMTELRIPARRRRVAARRARIALRGKLHADAAAAATGGFRPLLLRLLP